MSVARGVVAACAGDCGDAEATGKAAMVKPARIVRCIMRFENDADTEFATAPTQDRAQWGGRLALEIGD